MLMTKINPSLAFNSLLNSPSSNPVNPFHVVIHLPNSACTTISGSPSLGKASSHRKIQKPRHIPTLKPSYQSKHAHGNQWTLLGTNAPTMALLLKCSTNILLHVSIPFVIANSCNQIQSPNWEFHAFLYQAHKFH